MGTFRRRRSLWVGICVAAVFFVGVTLAVALVGGGPDIPHPAAAQWSACTSCHPTAGLPEGHAGRTDTGCRSCHSPHPDRSTTP
jgi:hypothetical protein